MSGALGKMLGLWLFGKGSRKLAKERGAEMGRSWHVECAGRRSGAKKQCGLPSMELWRGDQKAGFAGNKQKE